MYIIVYNNMIEHSRFSSDRIGLYLIDSIKLFNLFIKRVFFLSSGERNFENFWKNIRFRICI